MLGASRGAKKKGLALARPSVCGGDEEDRTPDLRIANATLSQLSYAPIEGKFSIGLSDATPAATPRN